MCPHFLPPSTSIQGFWTDHGGYYHNNTNVSGFASLEDALKAVKKDFAQRAIPVRYFQWDDYWMQTDGDVPGMLSWETKPNVFPSGFTGWPNSSLSLYAPEYSSSNVWIDAYEWKVDHDFGTAIPLETAFYDDLFRNGTGIGMRMFEQDFLCYLNTDTTVTNSDVGSGNKWFAAMDAAALANGVTMQFSMPNPRHVLASTSMQSLTNVRATSDNTRGSAASVRPMGPNGILFPALGVFASRDNVWTSPSTVNQTGCTDAFCYEPGSHADNAIAVLSGGPYGEWDGVGVLYRLGKTKKRN